MGENGHNPKRAGLISYSSPIQTLLSVVEFHHIKLFSFADFNRRSRISRCPEDKFIISQKIIFSQKKSAHTPFIFFFFFYETQINRKGKSDGRLLKHIPPKD
jgi:hypothetical protein